MKYYFLTNSLDLKIMGNYPQVKDVIYHCDIWNDPYFIEKVYFNKVNYNPIIANPILHHKSKLTDLIHLWNIGFSFTKLISGKLKDILSKYLIDKSQFFQCSIYKDDIEYNDYWLMNIYNFNNEFIDYKNCIIRYDKKADDFETTFETKMLILDVSSSDEFHRYLEIAEEKQESLYIEKLVLNEDAMGQDFIFLKNVFSGMYLVSEKLKEEIEDAGCTGIEFQPIHLSLNEWLHSEREKIYGKS